MEGQERNERLRIGEFATHAGTSPDTVRYYERLGLLAAPRRTTAGYRLYGEADLRRLLFIRQAKRLGITLDEIRDLLSLAGEGACGPLRQQVAELLRQKIAACEVQLAEVAAFKAALEERYHLALDRAAEPGCECVAFPATCGCLPVPIAAEHESGAADEQRPSRADAGPSGIGAPSA